MLNFPLLPLLNDNVNVCIIYETYESLRQPDVDWTFDVMVLFCNSVRWSSWCISKYKWETGDVLCINTFNVKLSCYRTGRKTICWYDIGNLYIFFFTSMTYKNWTRSMLLDVIIMIFRWTVYLEFKCGGILHSDTHIYYYMEKR